MIEALLAQQTSRAGPVPHRPRLSDRLRHDTRDAHDACERAMDLPARLADRAAYDDLLLRLQSVFRLLCGDPLLRRAEAVLGRDGQLRADLDRLTDDLGRASDDAGRPAAHLFDDLSEAVGGSYVVFGSRLGGQVIARMVRERLADAPTSYFTAGDEAPGPAWRAFEARLDAYGEAHPGEDPAVREGALRTFALFARAFEDVRQ